MTLRQRQPRKRDEPYLDQVRNCICLRCGWHPRDDMGGRIRCDAAHIRYADHRFHKPITGTKTKPDDRWTLPLCPRRFGNQGCHMIQHDWGRGEQDFWESLGIDATMLCYKASQDYDLGFPIIPWMLQAHTESIIRRSRLEQGRVISLWPQMCDYSHLENGRNVPVTRA